MRLFLILASLVSFAPATVYATTPSGASSVSITLSPVQYEKGEYWSLLHFKNPDGAELGTFAVYNETTYAFSVARPSVPWFDGDQSSIGLKITQADPISQSVTIEAREQLCWKGGGGHTWPWCDNPKVSSVTLIYRFAQSGEVIMYGGPSASTDWFAQKFLGANPDGGYHQPAFSLIPSENRVAYFYDVSKGLIFRFDDPDTAARSLDGYGLHVYDLNGALISNNSFKADGAFFGNTYSERNYHAKLDAIKGTLEVSAFHCTATDSLGNGGCLGGVSLVLSANYKLDQNLHLGLENIVTKNFGTYRWDWALNK